jgi:tRNA 2-thiouridine synthesizing protein E
MELSVSTTTSFEERIERNLDAIKDELDELRRAQKQREELFSEFGPILKEVMAVANERFESLERKGYFAMGRELAALVDHVVESYTAEDVADLGRNVVTILDTVRTLTQPQVLSLVGHVTEAAEGSDDLEPIGVLGMAKASQDEDAQRGMAVMVELLRRLGKGVKRAARRERLERQLRSKKSVASSVRRQRRSPMASRAEASPEVSASAPEAKKTNPKVAGVEFTPEGFLADPSAWSPKLAEQIAVSIGVELSEQHWKLVHFARQEWERTGASPNIRRLTTGSGLRTQQVYQMFPRAPGKCTAMIAGIPKPVGCI